VETHDTSGQCVSYSFIHAGSVLLPAQLFSFSDLLLAVLVALLIPTGFFFFFADHHHDDGP